MKKSVIALSLLVTCLSAGSRLHGLDKETDLRALGNTASIAHNRAMEDYYDYTEGFDFASGKSPMGPIEWSKFKWPECSKENSNLKTLRKAKEKIEEMANDLKIEEIANDLFVEKQKPTPLFMTIEETVALLMLNEINKAK